MCFGQENLEEKTNYTPINKEDTINDEYISEYEEVEFQGLDENPFLSNQDKLQEEQKDEKRKSNNTIKTSSKE